MNSIDQIKRNSPHLAWGIDTKHIISGLSGVIRPPAEENFSHHETIDGVTQTYFRPAVMN
jgi:hypothetical protein